MQRPDLAGIKLTFVQERETELPPEGETNAKLILTLDLAEDMLWIEDTGFGSKHQLPFTQLMNELAYSAGSTVGDFARFVRWYSLSHRITALLAEMRTQGVATARFGPPRPAFGTGASGRDDVSEATVNPVMASRAEEALEAARREIDQEDA